MTNQQPNDVTPNLTMPPAYNLQPQNTGQIKYAGFWIRLVATLIDGLVINAINLLIVVAVFIFLAFAAGSWENIPVFVSGFFSLIQSIFGLIGIFIGPIYSVAMTYGRQATLGKKLANIMVISDKSENLTLWQVILREIIGKIISGLILGIGYIMVGFTERKQGLHDQIARTLVVYKDPNKKLSVWVIILALLIPVFMVVAIFGIIATTVLVSLNTAKIKGNDALVMTTISQTIPRASIYQGDHGSFDGFKLDSVNFKLPDCSSGPILNISPDGQEMAIFGKLCSDSKKYYCADTSDDGAGVRKEVDEVFAKSGQTSCTLKQ